MTVGDWYFAVSDLLSQAEEDRVYSLLMRSYNDALNSGVSLVSVPQTEQRDGLQLFALA